MSSTIDEFCQRHRFSRQHFYNLKARGEGPRTFNVGRSVRISDEAEVEWIRTRESVADRRHALEAGA